MSGLFSYTQADYEGDIKSLSIRSIQCPNQKCNAVAFVKHGYYQRSIRFERDILRLNVLRLRCKLCDHTHSVLPSFIVPYSQIPLFDQLFILHCHLHSNLKASSDLINSNLDIFDIKRIILNFNGHWKERLKALNKKLFDSLTCLCNQFFKRQFMQIHRLNFYTFLEST